MSAEDYSKKLIEIAEAFGDLYKSPIFELTNCIMEAAFELRSIALRCETTANLLTVNPIGDATKREMYVRLNQDKQKLFIQHAEKLEREVAPQILTLAKSLEFWTNFKSSEREEYPEFTAKKETIRNYIQNNEYALSLDCDLALSFCLNRLELQALEMGDDNIDARVPNFLLTASGSLTFDHQMQDKFSNLQEWEIAMSLIIAISIIREEFKIFFRAANKFKELKHFSCADEATKLGDLRLKNAKKFKKSAVDVLKLYRQTSHCLWMTFQASNQENQTSDLFEDLATYLTDEWEAMMIEAKTIVKPMIEFNLLKIKEITN